MLQELRLALRACPSRASLADYGEAITNQNVLQKNTLSNRRRSLRSLRELYALDHDVLLFRALRDLWTANVDAQPLLAVLCAVARDPLLRASSALIVQEEMGTPISAAMFADVISACFDGRYNAAVLAKIGRNVASSWTQSGHLVGRTRKERRRVAATPVATAYALLLGYLCGSRGEALYNTIWCSLLDAPMHELRDHTVVAAQQGWLEYRHSGMVTEITFRHLLREEG